LAIAQDVLDRHTISSVDGTCVQCGRYMCPVWSVGAVPPPPDRDGRVLATTSSSNRSTGTLTTASTSAAGLGAAPRGRLPAEPTNMLREASSAANAGPCAGAAPVRPACAARCRTQPVVDKYSDNSPTTERSPSAHAPDSLANKRKDAGHRPASKILSLYS